MWRLNINIKDRSAVAEVVGFSQQKSHPFGWLFLTHIDYPFGGYGSDPP